MSHRHPPASAEAADPCGFQTIRTGISRWTLRVNGREGLGPGYMVRLLVAGRVSVRVPVHAEVLHVHVHPRVHAPCVHA